MAAKKKRTTKKRVVKKAAKKRVVRKKAVKRKPAAKKVVKKKATKKRVVKKRSIVKKATKRKTYTKKRGASMARKKTKRSYRRKRNKSLFTRGNTMKTLKNVGFSVTGAILAAMAANKAPVPNAKLKASLPIFGGLMILASKLGRNSEVAAMATGAMFIGGLGLVKQFQPNWVTFAGDDSLPLTYEDQLLLSEYGVQPDLMGESVDFGEEIPYYEDYEDDEDEFMGETVDFGGDGEYWDTPMSAF